LIGEAEKSEGKEEPYRAPPHHLSLFSFRDMQHLHLPPRDSVIDRPHTLLHGQM
jgi:hypothetical protein